MTIYRVPRPYGRYDGSAKCERLAQAPPGYLVPAELTVWAMPV
jgi:hypothetical protein